MKKKYEKAIIESSIFDPNLPIAVCEMANNMSVAGGCSAHLSDYNSVSDTDCAEYCIPDNEPTAS